MLINKGCSFNSVCDVHWQIHETLPCATVLSNRPTEMFAISLLRRDFLPPGYTQHICLPRNDTVQDLRLQGVGELCCHLPDSKTPKSGELVGTFQTHLPSPQGREDEPTKWMHDAPSNRWHHLMVHCAVRQETPVVKLAHF